MLLSKAPVVCLNDCQDFAVGSPSASVSHWIACNTLCEGSSPESCIPMYHRLFCTCRKYVGNFLQIHIFSFRRDSAGGIYKKR